jgi:uncharacterized protein YndB with AHSA1/START domain
MPTGETKDAGWQIGVSRTVDAPLPDVWELLTSSQGLGIWLGPDATLPWAKGETYETADGIQGELRSFRRQDRIRLTWQPATWSHDTTVQVAVAASGPKTMLRFHQERLADAAERERQRSYWSSIVGRLEQELGQG